MPKNLESRKKRAYELHGYLLNFRRNIRRYVREDYLVAGLNLKEIRDETYYKEMGFACFAAYIKSTHSLSPTTAYRYIKIATKISANPELLKKLMPETTANEILGGELEKIGLSIRDLFEIPKETLWQKISRTAKNMLKSCTGNLARLIGTPSKAS